MTDDQRAGLFLGDHLGEPFGLILPALVDLLAAVRADERRRLARDVRARYRGGVGWMVDVDQLARSIEGGA